MLDLGIDLDVWPWVWLVLAVAFVIIEMTFLGGTFVLLPFGASAFVASILAFYDVSIELQWLVFVGGGGALFVVLYRWARGFLQQNLLPPGVGADRLVGQFGTVVVDIQPDDTDRRGRVAVDGELWGALTDLDEPLPAGIRIRVASMRGTRVVVEPDAGRRPGEEVL